jgi:acyl carrier protein
VWPFVLLTLVGVALIGAVVWHHYATQAAADPPQSTRNNQSSPSSNRLQQAFEAEVRRQMRLIRERQQVEYVEQSVIALVAEKLSANKRTINRRTQLVRDLNADSLDLVELVMELEERFDILIPDDQTSQILTIGDAVDFIRARLVLDTQSSANAPIGTAGNASSAVIRKRDETQYDESDEEEEYEDGNEEEEEDDCDEEEDDSDESLEDRLQRFPSVDLRSADGHAVRVHFVGEYFPKRFGRSKHRAGASRAVLSLKSEETAGVRYFERKLRDCIAPGDAVIAVPGHTAGAASGGLRDLIAELDGLDDLSDCLVRTADVPSSHMARSEGYARPTEALHRETLAVVSPGRIRGRTILLMDDVLTTGATLCAAASVLRRAGAAQVCCLALTRTVRN